MEKVWLAGLEYNQFLEDIRAVVRHEMNGVAQQGPAPATEGEDLLTVAEAAQLLDVCNQTIHEWKRRGLLKFHKLGKRTYLKKSDVLGALQQQQRTLKPR